MRGARGSKAGRGGESGGVAAARADDAVAQLGNSGEVSRATGCVGTSSSGTGGLLTSLRGS
jgi:hypothetical protein